MSAQLIHTDFQQSTAAIMIKIECFGAIERLLPANLSLQYAFAIAIQTVVHDVQQIYPEAAAMLDRCACAIGEDIVTGQSILSRDSHLVLLSPVAGG